MKGVELMVGRDMNSIERDMAACIKHVATCFKGNSIPLEAAPVASLAMTMFDDYRENCPRDITEQKTAARKALLRIKQTEQL